MKFSPLKSLKPVAIKPNSKVQIQKQEQSFVDQGPDVVSGKKRIRKSIKEQITNIDRPVTTIENTQIEFLENIQEKIFLNLNRLTPEILQDTISNNSPSLCLECALLTLQTLFQIDDSNIALQNKLQQEDLQWNDLQMSLQNRERQFIKCLYNFQNLTINNQFQRQNIIRAKNYLLMYIVEEQLTNQELNDQNPVIKNIVSLAENIVGFIEVYDALIKSLMIKIPQLNLTQKEIDNRQQKLQQKKLEKSKSEEKFFFDKTLDIQQLQMVQIQNTVKKIAQYNNSKQPTSRDQTVNELDNSQYVKPSDQQKQGARSPKLNQIVADFQHESDLIAKSNKRVSSANPKTKRNQLQKPKDGQLTSKAVSHHESSIKKTAVIQNQQNKDQNLKLLNTMIQSNQSNIKQLMTQQIETKLKIENETSALKNHINEMEERDQIISVLQEQVYFIQKNKEQQQKSNLQKQLQKPKVAGLIQKQFKPTLKPKKELEQKIISQETKPTIANIEILKTNIQQSEDDRISLENELNRLLKIIEDKARTMPEQYTRVKNNLLSQ